MGYSSIIFCIVSGILLILGCFAYYITKKKVERYTDSPAEKANTMFNFYFIMFFLFMAMIAIVVVFVAI